MTVDVTLSSPQAHAGAQLLLLAAGGRVGMVTVILTVVYIVMKVVLSLVCNNVSYISACSK